MTREDIIRMARAAGGSEGGIWGFTLTDLERFAFLVAAERDARVCRIVTGLCISDNNAREICEAIRAKGEV